MQAGKQLYGILAKTGLYNLNNGKYIRAELRSYQVALAMVEEVINNIKNSAFLNLCSKEQLKTFEQLLCIPTNESINIENRRKMVRHRFSILKNDCNKEGLLKGIISAGMDADIIENKHDGTVTILCNTIFSSEKNYETIKNEVLKLMPAHLNVVIDIGIMDWNMFEAKNLNFVELDYDDFTWNRFDLSGHLIGGKTNGE